MSGGAVIIAATHSGAGKTTVATGLMAALKARGLDVRPFKVGPDFIDPAYHAHVTGAASRNLDGWMMGSRAVKDVYARASAGGDVCVIEGVMGLFDGIGRGGLRGSTAEVAKLTGAPVLLVVDARSMAGSAAAVVHGFETLDPDVKVAGVVLNRVGSKRHEELLRAAIGSRCRAKVIGALPRDESLEIPSRHLGLTTDVAGILTRKFKARLARVMEKSLDMDMLLKVAARAVRPAKARPGHAASRRPGPFARLAVAMDEAFCFYYPENLELIESFGVEIVPFSPLKDGGLPEKVSGIYLGGGYPEMYARGLSMNDFVKRGVREAVEAGIPVYAECGGLMYLTEGITDLDGVYHPMAGVLPVRASMLGKRKALGYREVTVTGEGSIFPKGKTARGHEFHYSELESEPSAARKIYAVNKAGGDGQTREGYKIKNVLASYVHLHFLSNIGFARTFAEKLKKVQAPFTRA